MVDLFMGQAPSSKDCNVDGRGTPFVKVGEFGDRRPVIREWTTTPLRMARRTDVLLCVVGATCGKINLGEDCAIGRSVAAIRPRPAELDQFYLYYFMLTLVEQLRSGSVGAAQTVISKEMIAAVQIPFVPLSEQQRIVGVLDEAFESIATAKANAEKNLENSRALFDSYLNSVFTQRGEGWVEKRLSEASKDFGRGKSKHRPRNDPKLYGGKYPFIQTGDVRNSSHLITSYSQSYNETGLAQSKLWPRGTLCITIAANIAETGILDFAACFPDSVIGVVVDENVTSTKFLEYLLQSFKAVLQAQGKGSAQDNINLGTFENQRFPFPPLGEQRTLVETFDTLREETERLERIYEAKQAAFEELKKSLLHRAFSGALHNRP